MHTRRSSRKISLLSSLWQKKKYQHRNAGKSEEKK
jgi:hypothetical protein